MKLSELNVGKQSAAGTKKCATFGSQNLGKTPNTGAICSFCRLQCGSFRLTRRRVAPAKDMRGLWLLAASAAAFQGPAWAPAAELKGSVGEGPNQTNYSDRSSVRILSKFSCRLIFSKCSCCIILIFFFHLHFLLF